MTGAGVVSLGAIMGAQGFAPSAVTKTVGTGILDAAGNEVTKDVTSGPERDR